MASIPISTEGFARLRDELENLKSQRPEVIQAIKEAREEGDLSENAGYDAARERQGMLEAKINFIESRMPQLNIVDLAQHGGEKAIFGATVKLVDLDTDEEKIYLLVGPDEADFISKSLNGISVFSPVGKALLGRHVGDEITIEVPRGKISYEILDIAFNGVYVTS